jgi:fermentation-respiration switch protein FrsA (DUF1100 family)
MLGHNGGPTMETGQAWRRHCWASARAALLPVLPVEVLRGRLRRAAELGLDYRTYAGLRAATGHDVIAVLFSSNALMATPVLPADRQARLGEITGAARIGLAIAPLAAPALLRGARGTLDASHPAPALLAPWRDARSQMQAILGRTPADRAILVAEHPLEAEWALAARMAGVVRADRYFGSP